MSDINEHNYGIDALRCIATLFVLTLHTVNRGGVLEASSGLNRLVILLVDIIALCAVNCYALVSGYVGYSTKKKIGRYSRWFELWLQIVFFNVLFCVVEIIVFKTAVGMRAGVKCFLPLTCNEYWYFTAYSVVFILMPYLNAIVANISKQAYVIFLLIVFFVFSVYSTATSPFIDLFHLNGGYSFCWLSMMYIVGAGIKRHGVPLRINRHKKRVFFCYVLANGFALIMIQMGFTLIPSKRFIIMSLLNYNSPFIFVNALLLLLLLVDVKFGKKSRAVIRFLAPVAFGVYLIQENPYVRERFVTEKFMFLSSKSVFAMFIGLSVAVVLQLVVGILIEKTRKFVFRHGLFQRLINRFGKCVDKIAEMINGGSENVRCK